MELEGACEQATLSDLTAVGLPVMEHYVPDLAAYRQLTFTGRVPLVGRAGGQIGQVLAELVQLGAIPASIITQLAS